MACVALLGALVGCSQSQQAPVRGPTPAAAQERAGAGRQLAYEHTVDIDTAPDQVARTYAAGLAACRAVPNAGCTLLDSRIDDEPEPGASLKFRARPDVIPKLVAALARDGELARQSTHAEDLSGPLADTARKLAMLEDYRARLEALRSRAGNDVEALIKINRELAEVQSSYETADGKRAELSQRVETEILNVSIRSDRHRPFWSPIGRAVRDFGGNLAQGIGIAVTGVAYLLPWLVVLTLLGWGMRTLWRWRRNATIPSSTTSAAKDPP